MFPVAIDTVAMPAKQEVVCDKFYHTHMQMVTDPHMWISVYDKLPAHKQVVVMTDVTLEEHFPRLGWYVIVPGWEGFMTYNPPYSYRVEATHWMPIPCADNAEEPK